MGPCYQIQEKRKFQSKFAKDLSAKLMKNKPVDADYKELFDIIEGIPIYLESGNKTECVTNKHLIRIRYLFRGHTIKL